MALVLAGGGLVCRDRHGAPVSPIWKADRYIAYGKGFSAQNSSLDGIVTLPSNPEIA